MSPITWLADVLRADGLTVVEHAGWKTRMRSGAWEPRFGVVHATAAPTSQSDSVQVAVVRDGRSDLPGPIAVACVDRQGRWHVLAAGRCNTTLVGTDGAFEGYGNAYAIGVEACNNNINEPWPAVQYEAYSAGWAAICRRMGWRADRLVGHKEHTPGHKTDPTFRMAAFRDRVQVYIDNPGIFGIEEEAEMDAAHSTLLRAIGDRWSPTEQEYLAASGAQADWDAMEAAGMVGSNGRINRLGQSVAKLEQDVAEIKATVTAPTPVTVDASQVAAALLANPDFMAALTASGTEARDAVGDLAEGGAAQVRADA